jgi:hypothetical protein
MLLYVNSKHRKVTHACDVAVQADKQNGLCFSSADVYTNVHHRYHHDIIIYVSQNSCIKNPCQGTSLCFLILIPSSHYPIFFFFFFFLGGGGGGGAIVNLVKRCQQTPKQPGNFGGFFTDKKLF